MVMQLYKHPTWAGGQSCVDFQPQCGIILNTHKQTFRDNFHDFAFNVATRYSFIKHWILWNEPNLAERLARRILWLAVAISFASTWSLFNSAGSVRLEL